MMFLVAAVAGLAVGYVVIGNGVAFFMVCLPRYRHLKQARLLRFSGSGPIFVTPVVTSLVSYFLVRWLVSLGGSNYDDVFNGAVAIGTVWQTLFTLSGPESVRDAIFLDTFRDEISPTVKREGQVSNSGGEQMHMRKVPPCTAGQAKGDKPRAISLDQLPMGSRIVSVRLPMPNGKIAEWTPQSRRYRELSPEEVCRLDSEDADLRTGVRETDNV